MVNYFRFGIQNATMTCTAILKFLSEISSLAKFCLEASAQHEASESLLQLFRYNIHDGRHGSHLEIIYTKSPSKPLMTCDFQQCGIFYKCRLRRACVASF